MQQQVRCTDVKTAAIIIAPTLNDIPFVFVLTHWDPVLSDMYNSVAVQCFLFPLPYQRPRVSIDINLMTLAICAVDVALISKCRRGHRFFLDTIPNLQFHFSFNYINILHFILLSVFPFLKIFTSLCVYVCVRVCVCVCVCVVKMTRKATKLLRNKGYISLWRYKTESVQRMSSSQSKTD
jgi:hypothetical protein